MKIGIYGAGAIGGYLAVQLANAGHEVTCIARGAHLAAMKAISDGVWGCVEPLPRRKHEDAELGGSSSKAPVSLVQSSLVLVGEGVPVPRATGGRTARVVVAGLSILPVLGRLSGRKRAAAVCDPPIPDVPHSLVLFPPALRTGRDPRVSRHGHAS